MGILAHDRKKHYLSNLGRILGLEERATKDLISNINFLIIDPDTGEVNFVTDSFRKFAASRLSHIQKEIYEILIEDLTKNIDSEETHLLLPGYLEQTGRYEDLLNFLSPDHFIQIIESSRSLSPLRQQATLGVNISKKLSRDNELMRFSTQNAILLGIDRAKAWTSELEALISINDYESALALAQSAILKEDLFQSLAVIAKKKLEKEQDIDQGLIEQIRNLYKQIDFSGIQERAIDIASDLIYSVPDLAIELIERTVEAVSSNIEIGWAFAHLSLATLFDKDKSEIIKRIFQKINNPTARDMTVMASVVLSTNDAKQVITEAEKFENPIDGLFLLRNWATENREREDAYLVVEHGLKLAIRTTEYTPSARHFRKLANPLPFVSNPNKTKELVAQIDGIKGTLIKFGPSEDFVRLQLLLAQAEIKYDYEAAKNRILEIYLYFINDLEDLSIKAACLARVFGSLDEIDPNFRLEKDYKFHTSIKEDLVKSIEDLLLKTGDHFEVTKGTINALAKKRPDFALEIAEKLNAQFRRDQAIFDILSRALDQPLIKIDYTLIINLINKITNENLKQKAIFITIVRISKAAEDDAEEIVKHVIPIISLIDQIESSPIKCNAYGLAYSFISEVKSNHKGLKDCLLNKLKSSWDSIDVGWNKVNFGFKTTETLSDTSPDIAREFYKLTEQYKENIHFKEETAADIYLYCLHLSIRSFIGLFFRHLDTKDDITRLKFSIDKIPSFGIRAHIWSDIARGYAISNRSDDCKRIVSEFVRPLLNYAKEKDTDMWSDILVEVSPVLFTAHNLTAVEEIKNLKPHHKDRAISNIIDFILEKVLSTDPYEYSPGMGFDVSYEELVDVSDLLSLIETDAIIYHYIELMADTLTGPRMREKYTREQKQDITRRLLAIIDKNLPDKNNIQHDGYTIISLAQVYRITQSRVQDWHDLIIKAKQVYNLSDQAFILTAILSSMPKKDKNTYDQIILDTSHLIEEIPALIDRIRRYEILSKTVYDIDKIQSKKYLDLGMQAAIKNDEPEAYSAQRRIIDFAYSKFGAEYATALAALADDDPARQKAKKNLSEQLELQKIKRDIVEQAVTRHGTDIIDKYSQICWQLLASLNGNRIKTYQMEVLRNYIEVSSILPIQESFPILSWIIQNTVKRYFNTEQARTIIRNIFDTLMMVTELSSKMAKFSSDQMVRAKSLTIQPDQGNVVIIHAGEREYALQVIKEWFEQYVREYIKICDQYFSPVDLDVLQLLQEVNPSCRVEILTSKKQQQKEDVSKPWEEAYRDYWRIRISDQLPPQTDIVIVGTEKTGDSPIHDRWWITEGSGLRIGTSFNFLGLKKSTEISQLTEEEALSMEKEMDQFLYRQVREYNGEKLQFTSFSL